MASVPFADRAGFVTRFFPASSGAPALVADGRAEAKGRPAKEGEVQRTTMTAFGIVLALGGLALGATALGGWRLERRRWEGPGRGSDAAVVVTRTKSALRKVVLEDLLGCRMPRPSPVYDLDDKGETLDATRRSGLPGSVVDEALLVAGALPEEATLDKQLLKEVQDGEMSPKALDLLSRLVIVDLPQDYS